MGIMNVIEKRDFIHRYLHQVKEPVIDEIYNKMRALLNESLIEESEDDIKKGNVITHDALKKEVLNWRHTK
ncbi:hypothetical protein DMA11_04705 [Marinilabiliaceae bacterium JC017]|nr:hypothetical protein DMA11_04705 [Marinilabiliaceae bacterium JC017]